MAYSSCLKEQGFAINCKSVEKFPKCKSFSNSRIFKQVSVIFQINKALEQRLLVFSHSSLGYYFSPSEEIQNTEM